MDEMNNVETNVKISRRARKEAGKKLQTPNDALPVAKRFLTFERRKSIWGWIFISPWLLGVILFFIYPMITAVAYTFSDIQIVNGRFHLENVGLENYHWALRVDATFLPDELAPSLVSMLWQVPIVVMFSVFVAMLIKEKFVGRTLARAIFFLPVIVSSGVVISILRNNILGGSQLGGEVQGAAYMFSAPSFTTIFNDLGVPAQITTIVSNVVSEVFDLTWKSGVQILLLLAAINNIPDSSYEVADMEGATAWEKFWKITFPMISSTTLVTIIYSIIDCFTDAENPVMKRMMEIINTGAYDQGTTIAMIYCVCVLVIIGIVELLIGKFVFYYNE